jgi:hypothetical protein
MLNQRLFDITPKHRNVFTPLSLSSHENKTLSQITVDFCPVPCALRPVPNPAGL